MTVELMGFEFVSSVFGFVWSVYTVLFLRASLVERRTPRKDMLVRYLLVIVLLLVLEIASLGVTFLLHWSRQSPHFEVPPQRHAVQLTN